MPQVTTAKRLPNGEVEMTVPIQTGIGIGTNIHPSGLVIEWIPADVAFRQADLAKGDLITAVNTVSIRGMDLAALKKFVRTIPVLEGGVLQLTLAIDSRARSLHPGNEIARVLGLLESLVGVWAWDSDALKVISSVDDADHLLVEGEGRVFRPW